jgi:hypothetical protein
MSEARTCGAMILNRPREFSDRGMRSKLSQRALLFLTAP